MIDERPKKGTGPICRDQPSVGARPEGAAHKLDLSPFSGELETLLAAAVNERLTEADRARLAELLREDGEALDCYVNQVMLHAMLRWEHAPPLGRSPECPVPSCESSFAALPGTEVPSPQPADVHPSSFILHPSSFSTGHSDLVGWLLSYAAATVIVGTAILGAWVYKVSLGGGTGILPVQIVNTGKMPVPPAGARVRRPDHGHGRLPPGRSTRCPARRRPLGPEV